VSDRRTYLGDGAYYDHDGYSVVLTTENGISTQNTIYLEPACVKALIGALCRDYGAAAIRAMLPETTS